ncbi:hypothetical protein OF83DRAFT_1057355 [Amylostereum chailletii]|nr:hypothetical protein OF83DRAFT_1057355 [Amylostereum chailletii]
MAPRQPYHGLKRRLVMGIDLGTTYSGVSYAILDPGKVPEINTVSRYPGQEAGDSKVQTVIWYNVDGRVIAVGAEEPAVDDEDEDDGDDAVRILKLEWFKLLLRPKFMATTVDIQQCKLPAAKNIVDVYADFYQYLFKHARAYIKQTHATGHLLLASFEDDIDIVLSHPNGWGGAQQSAMRRAAVKAGLVPDTISGNARVAFVSEGEASLHYCLASGLISEEVKKDNNVIVIDAGGGTVDLSTYTFTNTSPLKVQETAKPGCLCIFSGSDFIRRRATCDLTEKLKHSRFGTKSSVATIAHEFDQVAKKRFKGTGDSFVKFASVGDEDREAGIRHGLIKLTEEEVRGYFDPGIREIIRAVKAQQDAVAPANISAYFLVGGFAASEYLYNELDAHLGGRGSRLFRPDNHTGKAVAVGAVSFYIDHFVSTRVARLTYGTTCSRPYQRYDTSHRSRCGKVFQKVNGKPYLPGGFLTTIRQGTQVSETMLFKTPLIWTGKLDGGSTLSSRILCYRGAHAPEWMDEDPGMYGFSTLCTISADISAIPKVIQYSPQGPYWRQEFSVVLAFGLTELKAHLSWFEEVVHDRRGPAAIVYDDNLEVTVPNP